MFSLLLIGVLWMIAGFLLAFFWLSDKFHSLEIKMHNEVELLAWELGFYYEKPKTVEFQGRWRSHRKEELNEKSKKRDCKKSEK